MGATAEAHIDAVGADLDACTGLDELAEQRAGTRLGVVASQITAQHAVQSAGHQREVEVGIHF